MQPRKIEGFNLDDHACGVEGCDALVSCSVVFCCSDGNGLSVSACTTHAPAMLVQAITIAVDPGMTERVDDPRNQRS